MSWASLPRDCDLSATTGFVLLIIPLISRDIPYTRRMKLLATRRPRQKGTETRTLTQSRLTYNVFLFVFFLFFHTVMFVLATNAVPVSTPYHLNTVRTTVAVVLHHLGALARISHTTHPKHTDNNKSTKKHVIKTKRNKQETGNTASRRSTTTFVV